MAYTARDRRKHVSVKWLCELREKLLEADQLATHLCILEPLAGCIAGFQMHHECLLPVPQRKKYATRGPDVLNV